MTSGRPGDWEETKRQMGNPHPRKDGKTWLRHGENKQCGVIDMMLLEGEYSLEEMAKELNRLPGEPKRPISHRIKRIKDHIDHLQDGDPRGNWHSMEPHRLKLKEVAGKWMFDVG